MIRYCFKSELHLAPLDQPFAAIPRLLGRSYCIPTRLIDPNPRQPRKAVSEDEIKELAQDILQNGLLQPPVVRRKPNGRYELIFGYRRLRAMEQLGWKEILCGIIVDPIAATMQSGADLLRVALAENIQRQNLTDWEEAEALKLLKDELNLGVNELARLIHKYKSYVCRHLRVFDDPELADAVKGGTISVTAAAALLGKDEETRREMIGIGATTEQVRSLAPRDVALDNAVRNETEDDAEDEPEDDDGGDYEYAPSCSHARPSLKDILPEREEQDFGEMVEELYDLAIALRHAVRSQRVDQRCLDRIGEVKEIHGECAEAGK
ncbi:MAG: ParB/RepB/Spo0J family partition protein [Chloroflexi bacterium]|nr:ParB/RepB/Spo0J family partition protein [Chloroflexota bacterium]